MDDSYNKKIDKKI